MKHITIESIFTRRDDNIVEMRPNDDFQGELTMEGALDNIAVMKKLFKPNSQYKGLIIHIKNQYTKKEIIKCYHEANLQMIATALVSNSYVTNFVVNIILKLDERFSKKSTEKKSPPSKSFTNNKDATQWLHEMIAKANK